MVENKKSPTCGDFLCCIDDAAVSLLLERQILCSLEEYTASNDADDEECEEDKEENLGDGNRCACNASKTEERSDDRYN